MRERERERERGDTQINTKFHLKPAFTATVTHILQPRRLFVGCLRSQQHASVSQGRPRRELAVLLSQPTVLLAPFVGLLWTFTAVFEVQNVDIGKPSVTAVTVAGKTERKRTVFMGVKVHYAGRGGGGGSEICLELLGVSAFHRLSPSTKRCSVHSCPRRAIFMVCLGLSATLKFTDKSRCSQTRPLSQSATVCRLLL